MANFTANPSGALEASFQLAALYSIGNGGGRSHYEGPFPRCVNKSLYIINHAVLVQMA